MPAATSPQVIKEIQQLRKAGLRPEEIASQCDVHSNTVRRYSDDYALKEANKQRITAKRQKIREAYEAHPDWSYRQIAEHCGIHRTTVALHIKRWKEEEKRKDEPVDTKPKGPQAIHKYDCYRCAGTLHFWFRDEHILEDWQSMTTTCKHCGAFYKARDVIPYANLCLPEEAKNETINRKIYDKRLRY